MEAHAPAPPIAMVVSFWLVLSSRTVLAMKRAMANQEAIDGRRRHRAHQRHDDEVASPRVALAAATRRNHLNRAGTANRCCSHQAHASRTAARRVQCSNVAAWSGLVCCRLTRLLEKMEIEKDLVAQRSSVDKCALGTAGVLKGLASCQSSRSAFFSTLQGLHSWVVVLFGKIAADFCVCIGGRS